MENQRLRDIEVRYYATLRRVLKQVANEELAYSNEQLCYELERLTHGRLKPSPHWFLSGISGAGKSTTIRTLAENGFKRLPNVTTRSARPGEDKSDYVFVNDATFEQWNVEGRIFQPHITNKVWHGILQEDIDRIRWGNDQLFADKSVKSVANLVEAVPEMVDANLVYILAPTFWDLYSRIENREKWLQSLNDDEILDRFEEEIPQMEYTLRLPYAYIVNDSNERVWALISKFLPS